ncbi:MAG: hypothetical protein ACREID_05145, partial [Planctomycetota bacterium]
MSASPLRFRRLFALWAPLALTFLLLSGATPVINASINRLPGASPAEDLAGFALLLNCALLLHSPLLVTREIAIKLSVDRASARAALRYCVGAGACVSLLELVLAFTPLGALFLELFADQPAVVERARGALPCLAPMPVFIAARGVFHALQIRADETIYVAVGTLLRLVATAIAGFALAPHLGVSGAQLGALCMTFGAFLEAATGLR